MYLKAYIQNLVKIGPVVSEKSKFEFSYVNELWPRSRNGIDPEYSHTFINSISGLLQPIFTSLAATVSAKSIVFPFSLRKALITKFDLAIK